MADQAAKKYAPATAYYYQWDGYNNGFRWWGNNNPGDMWDLIPREELQEKVKSAEDANIRVVDHLPVSSEECDCGCHEDYNG